MSGRIAVGVSGTGSNLRALAAAADRGELGGEIALVFADRPCAGLDWAAEQGIETILVPGGDDPVLADTLAAVEPDAVVLAGYLRLVGPRVLERFRGRILNVHPALLPAFPGLRAVEQALDYGVKVFGVTVHFVDDGVDTGPVILQRAVEIPDAHTPEDVMRQLQPIEHELLPEAVRLIAAGAVRADPTNFRRIVLQESG